MQRRVSYQHRAGKTMLTFQTLKEFARTDRLIRVYTTPVIIRSTDLMQGRTSITLVPLSLIQHCCRHGH